MLKGAVTIGAAAALPSYAQMQTKPLKRGIRVAAGENSFGTHAPIFPVSPSAAAATPTRFTVVLKWQAALKK